MAPFWGWMAAAVLLGAILAFILLRLFVNKRLTPVWLLLFSITGALLVLSVLLAVSTVGVARDVDGRFAQSPFKSWFDGLRSGRGPCCSDADGTAISDADWESSNGHYRVRLPRSTVPGGLHELVWVEVPDDAVITEPNRVGRTMVWPIYGMQGLTIRCFMPGPMT